MYNPRIHCFIRLTRPLNTVSHKEAAMRNGFKGMVVALGVVAMMAAGCAKEEVVKKDEIGRASCRERV